MLEYNFYIFIISLNGIFFNVFLYINYIHFLQKTLDINVKLWYNIYSVRDFEASEFRLLTVGKFFVLCSRS